jgi:cell volume regulation protein A
MTNREKVFISWVGLRGAVPIVFATYPLIAELDKADTIFHLVFFISVTSVIIQGTTLPIVAKWLRLLVPVKAKRRTALDLELSNTVRSELGEMIIPADHLMAGKSIVDLDFPRNASIILLERDGKYIQPSGSTILKEGDKLVVLSDDKELTKILTGQGTRDKPAGPATGAPTIRDKEQGPRDIKHETADIKHETGDKVQETTINSEP